MRRKDKLNNMIGHGGYGKDVDFDDYMAQAEKRNGGGFTLDDLLRLRELQQRKIYLYSGIEREEIFEMRDDIMQYNRIDKDLRLEPKDRKPIYLYIWSEGGSIPDGFALVDAITTSITPVYTVNVGYCYSMAFYIAIAGHKRFTLPHSVYLLHEGQRGVIDTASKAQDWIDFEKRYYDPMKAEFICDHTKIDLATLKKREREEWYMSAEEALDLKVVDAIVGVTPGCTVDDIV